MAGNGGLHGHVCLHRRARNRLCWSHPCSPVELVFHGGARRGVLSQGSRLQARQNCRSDGGCLEPVDVPQPRLRAADFATVGFGMSGFVFREGGLRELGGKAFALLRLEQAGLPVPPWFVVAPSAFTASLTKEQADALASERPERTNSELLSLKPSDEILREVAGALQDLCCQAGRFAVRSSAVDEDGSQFSFAGQFDTFLFVDPEAISGKISAVWRSGFNDRILEYRRQHGLPGSLSPAPAVLIQKMVNADVSGVAFSADPVSGRRSLAVVSAVPGLGTALVGGEAAADVFKVDRRGAIAERTIVQKNISHVFDPGADEGFSPVSLREAEGLKPALSDAQAVAVAELARRAARAFGRPQDIE